MSSWLAGISPVAVEISNVCPHARLHPKCPRSALYDPVRWLDEDIILRTFAELGAEDYVGNVILSQYNDPLADPRLFFLMDKLRRLAPGANLHMWTASWLLTDELVLELARHGVVFLGINEYDAKEQTRRFAEASAWPMKVQYRNGGHDERLTIYDRAPEYARRPFCGLPGREVAIWSTGEVGLCCFDWRRSCVFGDLRHQSLRAILAGPARQAVLDNSAREGRYLGVCARCAHGLEGTA